TCLATPEIDFAVVSTDHPVIAEQARSAGARVQHRPAELSGDSASSESALLHCLAQISAEEIHPRTTVFVQPTSPFIDSRDLSAAVKQVESAKVDCCFSGVPTHSFLWSQDKARGLIGRNHDARYRPRRQELPNQFRETGAFYVLNTAGFLQARHRFFGTIGVQCVDPLTAVEVDSPLDLQLARCIAHLADRSPARVIDVDAVVTDFDGIHTDDTATINEDGVETVRVSRADGMGVARVRRAGVQFLVLSSETNPVVSARASKLSSPVLQGVNDKASALLDWMTINELDPSRVAYLGNDVNDLGALAVVGWPITVPEACPAVRAMARVVLDRSGGNGAVRDLCDRVLAAKGDSHD
ncbi:MAG: cytidylyltransferase domain-containing protein, partial [Angustibacter sp.]